MVFIPPTAPHDLYTFSTSTVGGQSAFGDLCDAHARTTEGVGQYPVVTLGSDSYQHKNRTLGRVKVPVFKIVDCVEAAPFNAMQPAGSAAARAIPTGAPPPALETPRRGPDHHHQQGSCRSITTPTATPTTTRAPPIRRECRTVLTTAILTSGGGLPTRGTGRVTRPVSPEDQGLDRGCIRLKHCRALLWSSSDGGPRGPRPSRAKGQRRGRTAQKIQITATICKVTHVSGPCATPPAACVFSWSTPPKPLVAHWRDDASADPAAIEGWLAKWRHCEFAWAMPADVLAVDVDLKHGKNGHRRL